MFSLLGTGLKDLRTPPFRKPFPAVSSRTPYASCEEGVIPIEGTFQDQGIEMGFRTGEARVDSDEREVESDGAGDDWASAGTGWSASGGGRLSSARKRDSIDKGGVVIGGGWAMADEETWRRSVRVETERRIVCSHVEGRICSSSPSRLGRAVPKADSEWEPATAKMACELRSVGKGRGVGDLSGDDSCGCALKAGDERRRLGMSSGVRRRSVDQRRSSEGRDVVECSLQRRSLPVENSNASVEPEGEGGPDWV